MSVQSFAAIHPIAVEIYVDQSDGLTDVSSLKMINVPTTHSIKTNETDKIIFFLFN